MYTNYVIYHKAISRDIELFELGWGNCRAGRTIKELKNPQRRRARRGKIPQSPHDRMQINERGY